MATKGIPKFFEFNGAKIPTIGIGTAYMSSNVIADVIYSSIKDGTRLIDTAAVYMSEEGVGKGIKKAISEGIVKREDLFVTTKLSIFDMAKPEEAVKKSLKMLGLDYIDLYLLHWPKFFDYKNGKKVNITPMHEVWPKMEQLVEKGYTKYIGVSNYNVQSLLNLLSFCKIKPLVNEIEFHPYLYQKKLVEFCRREDIILFGYNPLVKGCYSAESADEKHRNLLGEPLIIELAKKYNKTVGQVVLNWSVSREVIPIPMTCNPHRMLENIGSTDFVIEKEDLGKIDKLNRNQRYGLSYIWNIYDNEVDVFA